MNVQEESNKLIEELEKENDELKKENKKLKDKNKSLEYCNEKLRCDNNYFEQRILFELRQNKEILKLNETILKENDNKSEQLEKCKKLLRMATEDIRKLLCEEYGSTCQFCIQEENKDAMCAKIGGSGGWCCENAKWKHADEVREVLKDE